VPFTAMRWRRQRSATEEAFGRLERISSDSMAPSCRSRKIFRLWVRQRTE
jgi:hypothetical protein